MDTMFREAAEQALKSGDGLLYQRIILRWLVVTART